MSTTGNGDSTMRAYLTDHWLLLITRLLTPAAILLLLSAVTARVEPAPLASSGTQLSAALAVSVSFALPAAGSAAPTKSTDVIAPVPAAPVATGDNSTQPATAKASASVGMAMAEPATELEAEPPSREVIRPNLPLAEDPTLAMLAESEPALTTPALGPPADTVEPQTATVAEAADIGAHQPAEFVEPLFAAPPTPPRYPTIARKRGREGIVWIEISLDADGQQADRKIVKSSGWTVLDESALMAVAEWRFLPHQADGVKIASRLRVPVKFSLH